MFVLEVGDRVYIQHCTVLYCTVLCTVYTEHQSTAYYSTVFYVIAQYSSTEKYSNTVRISHDVPHSAIPPVYHTTVRHETKDITKNDVHKVHKF